MLVFAETFFYYLRRFRVSACTSYLGSGKTLLGVAIAEEFLRRGWVKQVWANFPNGFTCGNDRTGFDTFFLLDEAWDFADARDSSKGFSSYGAFLRKRRSYLFAMSVYEVDKRLRQVRVERVGTVPVFDWLYKWTLYDTKTFGTFCLKNPSHYFGTFDTEYEPEGDDGMREHFDSLRAKKNGRIIESKEFFGKEISNSG